MSESAPDGQPRRLHDSDGDEEQRPVEPGAPPPVVEDSGISRWIPALGVVVVWIVVWSFTKGNNTLALPGREHTDLHQSFTDFNNRLLAGRDTNPVMQFTNAISELLRTVFDWLQRLLVRPNLPRPVPEIGWLGIVAVATWVGYAIASWRIALLVLASFLSFGVFGYWEDSLDLLIVTGMAVGISLVVGLPLAVLAGTERPRQQGDHRRARLHADDADLRLPRPDRAVLRHRRRRCRGLHAHLRRPAAGADRRLRHPRGVHHHDRGHRLGRPDLLAAARQGAAPDGAQDDHRRPQPDHPRGPLDGDHRGLHQRPRPREAGPQRARRQRLRRQPSCPAC